MTPQHDSTNEFDHDVTYRNTVKHWVLYTLDAIEAENQEYDEPSDQELNEARNFGTVPEDIYDFAAGDDSIVFWNEQEIASTLSELGRMAEFWQNENRPVNRRTDATDWEGPDVKYRYRLTEFGRNVLLDLGVPDQLPNRRDLDEEGRMLGVKPGHQPGWWQDEYELYGDEWDIHDNDWIPTDHERVFYKDDGDHGLGEDRGYSTFGEELAEAFPEVTFVLTVGPYRQHDIMYAIRDPWRKVVQIDVYSPMALHRSSEEISANFESLVKDLHKGLESVTEEDDGE